MNEAKENIKKSAVCVSEEVTTPILLRTCNKLREIQMYHILSLQA